MIKNYFIKTLFIFALLWFNGCKSEQSRTLYINIDHVVQGEKLVFEDKVYSTAAGHDFKVFRLKYYLSDFVLEKEDGTKITIDTVHLCNAVKPDTYHLNLGQIPVGHYKKISFILGLNKEKNKEGSLENNMENNTMEWPVIGEKGYHYMKFEGKYDSLRTNTWKNFNLHTGPTQNNENFVTYHLNLPAEENDRSDLVINLEMDIHRLLHGPKDYDFNEFGQGIMANQRAQEILQQNAANFFQIKNNNKTR